MKRFHKAVRMLLTVSIVCSCFQVVYAEESGGVMDSGSDRVTVWDMSALPDNPGMEGWAGNTRDMADTSITGGKVEVLSADGMGYDGGRALEYRYLDYNGSLYYANGVKLYPGKDATAKTHWYGAEELWFWIDASDQALNGKMIELTLNGNIKPIIGEKYYLWNNGEKTECTLPSAWDGANYARFQIGGYKGWVCVPMSSFGGTVSRVNSIDLYMQPDVSKLPASLYMDDISIVRGSGAEEPCPCPESVRNLWDMESLPIEHAAGGWAYDSTPNQGAGISGGKVDLLGKEGEGYLSSRTMEYRYLTPGDKAWANGVTVDISRHPMEVSDWTNAEELWFWIDATELTNGDKVELGLNGAKPMSGREMYLWKNGEKETVILPVAYNGVTYARLPLGGYRGWVCLPLSSFNEQFETVEQLNLYIQPNTDNVSIFLDDFRLKITEKEDTEDKTGESFNSDIPANGLLLYTDVTKRHQEVKAFGASGCWWATGIDKDSRSQLTDELISLLYTDEGIALNNYRHNVGGSMTAGDGPTDPWRYVPSPLNADGSICLDNDANSYAVLKKVANLSGISDITLFMNSPPSSMTVSGKTYADGNAISNLKRGCYEAYAQYVIDVVEAFLEDGISVKYISPINEPQHPWNEIRQEGCHYEPADAIEICKLVIGELNARSKTNEALRNVKVSMPESAKWSDYSYVNSIYKAMVRDSEIAPYIDHFASHSYSTNADQKRGVARFINSLSEEALPLHQTEWGNSESEPAMGISTAVELGRCLYEDLTILDVESWSWWLGVSKYNYSDGLIYVTDQPNDNTYKLSKRFWTLGNYSKYIKGYTRVEVDESLMPDGMYSSAYVSEDGNTITYVVGNEKADNSTFTFFGLPAGAKAEVYETSSKRNCNELRGTMLASNGYEVPGKSVTTFVFRSLNTDSIEKPPVVEEPEDPGMDLAEGSEVFGFEGIAPQQLVRPEDHEQPGLLFVEDPSLNGGWAAVPGSFALNNLYLAAIAEDGKINGSKELQWHCVKSGGTSELMFNLEQDSMAVTDWSGAKGLQFSVDFSEYGGSALDTVNFYFRLTEMDILADEKKDDEVWTLNGNGSFWLEDGNGGWEEHILFGNWIEIPPCYSGKVRMMLSRKSLTPVTWQSPISGELELADVASVWIGIANPAFAVDGTASIDSFRILTENKSGDADIISVTSPNGIHIEGTNLTGSVSYETEIVTIDVIVIEKASWKLYGDAGCTAEIQDGTMSLAVGENTAYIKVMTENGTMKVYSMTITRASDDNGSGGTGRSTSSEPAGTDVNGTTITPSAAVSNSATTARVSGASVKKALENALNSAKKDGKAPEVIVNVPEQSNTAAVAITIPKNSLEEIEKSPDTLLTAKAADIIITFNDPAIAEIDRNSKEDIVITSGKAEISKLTEEQKMQVGDKPVYSLSVTSGDVAITDFKGNVRVSIPYTLKPGENPNAIVVYYVDGKGNLRIVENSVYDSVTGRVTFTTTHFSVFMIGSNPVEFEDVKDHWGKPVIDFAAARGLVSGVDKGRYQPDRAITRAEFVQMVQNVLKLAEAADIAEYSDVAADQWYYRAIMPLKAAGLLQGIETADNHFMPNRVITREEMAMILANAAAWKKLDISSGELDLSERYKDFEFIKKDYLDEIQTVVKLGLMSGDGIVFNPKEITTRAQAVEVQINLLKLLMGT